MAECSTLGFAADRADRLSLLQDTHFWFDSRRRAVEALLGRRLEAPSRVLDLGCGAGAMLARLDALGHEAVGVDGSPASLAHARRRAPGCVLIEADAAGVPLPDASFDGVLLLDVLEHVDDRAALAEARRLLRPGGWLLASVPAWPFLWGVRDIDAGHLRRYTHRSLSRLVREARFETERLTFSHCSLFPALVAARLAGRSRRAVRDAEEHAPASLDAVLRAVGAIEALLVRYADLPVGSSFLVRARRP